MSQKSARGSSPTPESSTTASNSGTVLTPSSSPTNTPQRGSGNSNLELEPVLPSGRMEKEHKQEGTAEDAAVKQDGSKAETQDSATKAETTSKGDDAAGEADKEQSVSDKKKLKRKKKKCRKHNEKSKHKSKSTKSVAKARTVSDSDSDSEDHSDDEAEADESSSESSSSSSSSSSSEDERARKKRKARAKRKAALKKKAKAKAKAKKHKKSRKYDSSSDSSDSDSDSSDEADSDSSASSVAERSHRRRSSTKSKRTTTVYEATTEPEETAVEDWTAEAETAARLAEQVNALQFAIQTRQMQARSSRPRARVVEATEPVVIVDDSRSRSRQRSKKKVKKDKDGKVKKASTLEFKRVDQVWDTNIHAYKCQESAEAQEDEFDQYIFTVRRRFNWENKYRDTVIDLKSKILREALQELMKDVKSVSLVEEQPCLDPNTLFLYLQELRKFYSKTLKARLKKQKKRKQIKHLKLMRSHVKVMLKYLDEDYSETKKALYPLLEAGNITFEYLWALFKPNSLAYTTTYGTVDEPRCFKVDYAYKESSMLKGEWYAIEGRYLEYDGKHFGLGDFETEIPSFRGPRKISSLPVYPLSYHKDVDKTKELLLERGKKFVVMQGMNYKFSKGLAFQKRKQGVAKVNINGRIMIDPAIFRRINPNYRISVIKAKDEEGFDSDDEDDCSDCDCGDGGEEGESKQKLVWRFIKDKDDKYHYIQVPVDEDGVMIKPEKLEPLANAEPKDRAESVQHFDEEELLIASPVVYGFSFQEKLWLEFTLSSIKDIEWNEGAFDSLVIPSSQKGIVRALVSSHKFHAAETIDDVVQGKGKGLVFVLHGPPGVGKTLTGEGIAEMLRCPLYMVSAGELGTDYRTLELELQKIMDIAHSWGAVLLLDEADVFLEKRQIHDISRNALVSIFLRILEYFQGILFLTTNRVETFDEAFQSRIHVALRYEELGHKAKKEIWKAFLRKVAVMEGSETGGLTDRDCEILARHNMNGRQIKNAVKTAQALAVNEKQKLSMEHVERVLAVAESFDRDLRGLTLDAMKSYI